MTLSCASVLDHVLQDGHAQKRENNPMHSSRGRENQ